MKVDQPPARGGTGPYETEQQARGAAHAVIAPEPGWSILRVAGNRQLLGRALEAAGVSTGRYDDRIAEWMGQWEDSAVAVVAGWVTRAAASRADAATEGDGGPRCAQCGGPAEQYPDPYMDRMLWRHQQRELPASVAEFLDAEHEAIPEGAL